MPIKEGKKKSQFSNGAIILFASAVFLAMIFVICPTLACGPFLPEAVFSQTRRPDLPLTRYAAGELGIVQPTFARSYLAVAYLYLTNRKLTTDQRRQAANLWWHRLTEFGTPELDKSLTQWRNARKKINIRMQEDFDFYRHISERNYTS